MDDAQPRPRTLALTGDGAQRQRVRPLSAPPTAAAPARRAVLAWSVIWALLAVLHVTQAIWVSGGQAYPGDLGDGRFNQLVLEHGWQSLRGHYEWTSPGQFFPQTGTLAYSDTHAGTLPVYAALRLLSVSRDEAWQLWFIIIAGLNTWAAFRLFRALDIDRWLRGPLVFASAASGTMVWLAGTHMQMLPVFPALLAWEQMVRWTDDRAPTRIALIAGWLGWQFAAGPYAFFFAAVISAAVAAGWWLFVPATASRPAVATGSPRRWLGAAAVFVTGAAVAAIVAYVYLGGLRAGHTRHWSELVDLAPRPGDWFSAPPVRCLFPAGWPGGARDLVEHAWLAGIVPWALLLAGAAGFARLRQTRSGGRALALGFGAIVTMLFFTRWSADFGGAWVWLSGKVEALHAFRASGRVAGLLQFALIGAAGLVLNHWARPARSRAAYVACVVLASLMALENLSSRQPSTRNAVAQARQRAVVEAWRTAGDRPVLAFAPGFSNQPDPWLQLDAWAAALQLRRVTINGYTGGVPGSHLRFVWEPTEANARQLLAATGVPENKVSVVTALSPVAEQALDFQRFPERPLMHLDGFDLQPERWALFTPVERHEVGGQPMYQFTPPAEVRFRVPDDVTEIAIDVALRPGSYDGSGHSDGIDLTWVLHADAGDRVVDQGVLNPRDRPADRGVVTRRFRLPEGAGRVLILRVGDGPAQSNAWDWAIFGRLRTLR